MTNTTKTFSAIVALAFVLGLVGRFYEDRFAVRILLMASVAVVTLFYGAWREWRRQKVNRTDGGESQRDGSSKHL
jgi:threonine/homoserine/homoserine lactone efflux protein